jgi:hypothetical protein
MRVYWLNICLFALKLIPFQNLFRLNHWKIKIIELVNTKLRINTKLTLDLVTLEQAFGLATLIFTLDLVIWEVLFAE